MSVSRHIFFFFFFNDTATTEIYTLSLHELFRSTYIPTSATSISSVTPKLIISAADRKIIVPARPANEMTDRKSTRLNSSHGYISYAVFCLKKKKQTPVTLSRDAT